MFKTRTQRRNLRQDRRNRRRSVKKSHPFRNNRKTTHFKRLPFVLLRLRRPVYRAQKRDTRLTQAGGYPLAV